MKQARVVSHFPIAWKGNKRTEMKNIIEHVPNVESFDTIVEPYCGSCAFSYYMFTNSTKKFKYVLNDNDGRLMELLQIMKDDARLKKLEEEVNEAVAKIKSKDDWKKLDKEAIATFIIHGHFSSRYEGLYDAKRTNKPIKFDAYGIVRMMKSEDVALFKMDGVEIIEKYKNDPRHLIFIDPPYPEACNDFYSSNVGLNAYEYLCKNKINEWKCFVVGVLPDIWMIRLLFDGQCRTSYNKTYQITKRKINHMIITNH